MATLGDLATFVLRQEEAVQACEVKRAGLAELITTSNEAQKPRSFLSRLRQR